MKQLIVSFQNRVKSRVVLAITLITCLLALGQGVPVQAGTYYFRWGPPLTYGPFLSACDATHNRISGIFDINVKAGMTYSMVEVVHGVQYGPFTGTYSTAQTATGVVGYLWIWYYSALSFPYNVSWTFTLKAQDGRPLTLSSISFTCASPGTLTNVVVTNIDLTAGPLNF